MKRKLLIAVLAIITIVPMLRAEVRLDSKHFPDFMFRQAVSEKTGVAIGGIITDAVINEQTDWSQGFVNKGITNLKGIEHFINLQSLNVNDNNLLFFDARANTRLTQFQGVQHEVYPVVAREKTADGTYEKRLRMPENFVNEGACRFSNSVTASNGYTVVPITVGKDAAGYYLEFISAISSADYSYTIGRGDFKITGKIRASFSVPLTSRYFPDAEFRAAVSAKTGVAEGESISYNIVDAQTNWSTGFSGKNIHSVVGIEYFTSLEEVNLGDNQIYDINLTLNKKLTGVYLRNNQLIELNLSKNTSLASVDASGNLIGDIDLKVNTALTNLNLGNNKLASIDLSTLTRLNTLNLSNNGFSAINLAGNTALASLDMSSNKLTAIDLAGNTALTSLSLACNKIATINLTAHTKLAELNLANNEFNALNLSSNTVLKTLDISYNHLVSFDATKLTRLKTPNFVGQTRTLNAVYSDGAYKVTLPSGFDGSRVVLVTSSAVTGPELVRKGTYAFSIDAISRPEKFLYQYDPGAPMTDLTEDWQFQGRKELMPVTIIPEYDGNGPVIAGVMLNEANFPDANFRAAVSAKVGVDEGCMIPLSVIDAQTDWSTGFSGKEIANLKGVENFIKLAKLNVSGNNLTYFVGTSLKDMTAFTGTNQTVTLKATYTNGKYRVAMPSDFVNDDVTYVSNVATDGVTNPTLVVKGQTIRTKVFDIDPAVKPVTFTYTYRVGTNNAGSRQQPLPIPATLTVSVTVEYEGGIVLDKVNFPDDNFRAAVGAKVGFAEGELIPQSVINAQTDWRDGFTGKEIADLKGIEHFKELMRLDVSGNHLTYVVASELEKLTDFKGENQTYTADATFNKGKYIMDMPDDFVNDDHTFVYRIITDGVDNPMIRVVAGSGDTPVKTKTFVIDANLKPETFTYGYAVGTTNLEGRIGLPMPALLVVNVTPTYIGGFPYGDVTGDCSVDINDINAVANVILGSASGDDYYGRADVTGDGVVDVSDIDAIIASILN